MNRPLLAGLLTLGLCLASGPGVRAAGLEALLMEPAKTRVGLARVKLLVQDLRFADAETIVGSYEIRIPLAPWRNDRGEIQLRSPGPIGRYMTSGATINGSGHSEDGQTHAIACRFGDDGTVRISVATPDGDLLFKTRYEILER